MKNLLRSARNWGLRPNTNQLDELTSLLTEQRTELQELRRQLAEQNGLVKDAVRGSALPYLEEIGEVLGQQQLGFRDTLERIRRDRLSFARFGDGEFKLMLRPSYRLRFQPPSEELAAALKDVFVQPRIAGSNILIGFPTLYRDLHWSRVWLDIWPEVRSLLPEDQIFGNSHVSRPVCFQVLGREGVDAWRAVWQDRDIVLITGKDSRMTLIPELFDNIGALDRIESLPVDAFSDLDRVMAEVEAHRGREVLFLIALGPTGTVLAHRISQLGEQAIDIGHISDSYETVFEGAAWPESKPLTREG